MTRSLHRLVLLALFGVLLLPAAPLFAQFGYGQEPDLQGTGFGKNKIQYRQFVWHTYRSPHFNVHYYDGEESRLQALVSIAESAYDTLSKGFNYQIKEPIPLIYFATHSAFEQNNVILGFVPEGVGAFASPARFRMVLPVDLSDSELMKLVQHELTHIFQYQILYQGNISRAVGGPPTWFMEGMASFMAKDESVRDQMFLRDAVVNDRIPPVSSSDFGGFFAYRFGHAVFDFVEERWGHEGFLDFIYEVRNTFGSRIDRAVLRAFKIEGEEFDLEFRRWLRKKYLPQLLESGEPGDFGRIFRIKDVQSFENISPTASPSGDLVASLSIYKGKVDVVLFDARKRTFLRNLTSGYSSQFQYLAAQELILGRGFGRDLSFSPDGNRLALFAKRERGRSLMLLDVLNGGIQKVIDMPDIEQQLAPSWSPDGTKIAFSGWRNGHFDVFQLDLATETITPLTNDEIFDGGPVYSPDGKSIALVSVVGKGFAKIFRIDLAHPGQRIPITTGESNENDPIYSPDGKRLYFTSDRGGRENIWSYDFDKSELRQYTNVVSGAFMPVLLREPSAPERLVFTGYWKGSFDLYVTDIDKPVTKETVPAPPSVPANAEEVAGFEPDIQVTIDPANKGKYKTRKFFLEDAQSFFGVDTSQTYTGRVLLSFSDYLGNHRILADISAVSSFSNFDFTYVDFSKRRQWQVEVFDQREFYLTPQISDFQLQQRQETFRQTGALASIVYPLTFYNRLEVGAGFVFRKIEFADSASINPDSGILEPHFISISDNFPVVQGALVGDTALFANWGAIAGHRWRLGVQYAPDLSKAGTLTSSANLDFRQYLPVTQRSNLAFRGFVGLSEGHTPNPYYFGGLDTLRSTDFRQLSGDRAFFANVEYRFPLIDVLATPILGFQGIRGNLFLDVGGAWYKDFQTFRFYNAGTGRLQDAIAAYGWGFSTRLLGLDVNWDFARRWDLKQSKSFGTSFWIGTRF